MAGLAYDITRDIKLDLGYRYRHIDGGPMFSFDPATAVTGASGTQGEFPDFDTHEVRVGVRYSIW
jgi:opacity protein-like surface antigen